MASNQGRYDPLWNPKGKRRDPFSRQDGPIPAAQPSTYPRTTPEVRKRLGHELADLLDDTLRQHPDLALAFIPKQEGFTHYTMGMWEGGKTNG